MTQAWPFRAPCPIGDRNWVRDLLVASAGSRGIFCGTFAGTFGQEAVSSSARVAKLMDRKPGTSDSHFLQILRSISFCLRKSQPRRKHIKKTEQVRHA